MTGVQTCALPIWTNVLNLALPPQRHRPDAQPEHQDPVIHTAQNKREKKRKKEREQPNQKTNPPVVTSARNYTKKKKETDRKNPRTDGKSTAIQTKSHTEAYITCPARTLLSLSCL